MFNRTNKTRYPTMQDSLRVLLESGVEIDTVLDVGILTGTAPLIQVFPTTPHHLFEPVDLHFKQIEKNYRNINSKLHHVALSDSEGSAYLACRSINRDGRITHSEVVDAPVTVGEISDLVECRTIPKCRLDTIVAKERISDNCLLKIDVDGHEIPILRGADKTLLKTCIVVIEAPLNRTHLPHFFERSTFLRNRGFYLMDIVDLSFYNGVLWQVDLVFVREDIVNSIERLRPFEAKSFSFQRELWQPMGEDSYGKV